MRNRLLTAVLFGFSATVWAQEAKLAPPWEPETIGVWRGIIIGGPIYLGLHVLILASFILGIFLAVHRPHSVWAAPWTISPALFGAITMWIGVVGVASLAEAPLFDGNISVRLRLMPRPFFGGLALSTLAVFALLISKHRQKHRNA